MKLVRVDKTVSPQEYHYECVLCPKKKIAKQDKKESTDYCHRCFLSFSGARTGTGKYGLSTHDGDYCKERHKIARELRKEVDRKCAVCKKLFNSTSDELVDTCVPCSNIIKGAKKSNTSGYVGVAYIKPRVRKNKNNFIEQGYWYGRMMFEGKRIFNVEYKDSYSGTDEYKKMKCAIDRDMHIREKGLNHYRNFTDNELDELATKFYINLQKCIGKKI